jgi:hypothetical protein
MRCLGSLKPAVPWEAKAPDSFSRTVPVRASTLNIRKQYERLIFRGLGGDRVLGA